MVKTIPYLLVENGKRALELYQDLFSAKIINSEKFTPEIGKPMGFPDDFDYENSTMHAEIDIGGAIIYLADDSKKSAPQGRVEVVLDLDSKNQIDEIWAKVEEKKFQVNMQLEKTFWGAWFGRFTDSEGVGWQLNFQEDSRK